MKSILKVFCFAALLLTASCHKDSNPVDSGTPTIPSTGGKISTGQSVDLGSQTIGTSGGSFTINKTGDPLNGFQITVPQQAFSASKTFSVSYASVTTHQYGSTFTPVSPLIKISYDGGYSDMPMSVRVPIYLPSGYYAMGFFYDETTGDLEAVPTMSLDTASITISTRHFSNVGQTLSKGLFKTSGSAFTSLIISSIKQSLLDFSVVLSTDFAPGKDDWEFPNRGSYIAPGGHCAGQSMSAIWYYYEKYKGSGEPRLFHRYDKVNDPSNPDFCWFDNPLGYRFASTIQCDFDWDNLDARMISQAKTPDLVWHDFVDAFLNSGKPQLVAIRDTVSGRGHAMVVYKIDVSQGILYVADPNKPGNFDPSSGAYTERKILYQGGKFLPYSSAAFADDVARTYQQIGFGGKTAYIPWDKITSRWQQFLKGTIGNDRFPTYSVTATPHGTTDDIDLDSDALGTDTLEVTTDTLLVRSHNQSVQANPPVGGRQPLRVCDAAGNIVGQGTTANDETVQVPLALGYNKFGFAIFCYPTTAASKYVDFKWWTFFRAIPLTIASTEANGAPVSTSGVKNKVYTFIAKSAKPVPKDGKVRYDWSFDNGATATSVNNDSTTTHTFTNDGTYTMRVTLYYNGNNIGRASATAMIASAVSPAVDSVRVNPDGLYPGVPALTWGLPGWRLDVYGQNFMSGATDTPSVYIGTNKLPVVYSTSREADAIIPTMATGTYNVSVTRKDGVASDSKPIYIGIPQSDIDLHSNASVEFTFYYTYYNAVMGRVDTMGVTQVGIYGTVAWTSNGFTITKTPIPTVDFPEYGTAAVTFSQGEANVDLKWYVLDRYRGYTPDDSIHYTAQHVRARGGWIQAFPPLAFSADTPAEMTRVTTQLSGIVVSRQGAHGLPITGLVPVGSSFSITLPGITR
jgi:hypothetical protein